MIQVTAALIKNNGKFLIARRKSTPPNNGKWEFPGGKLEPEETPEQCLARELLEEFGTAASVGGFVCSAQFVHNETVMELLAYEASLSSKIRFLAAHDKALWMSVKDIAHLDLLEADVSIVNFLLEKELP